MSIIVNQVCSSKIYEIPTKDAACASVVSGNMTAVFDLCCKGSGPVRYNNDCGIYCLAQEQDVHKLHNCLTSKSYDVKEIYCNARDNATATAAITTGIATATLKSSSSTASSTSTSTSTHNAAASKPTLSKAGLGVIAMLFCSTLTGLVL